MELASLTGNPYKSNFCPLTFLGCTRRGWWNHWNFKTCQNLGKLHQVATSKACPPQYSMRSYKSTQQTSINLISVNPMFCLIWWFSRVPADFHTFLWRKCWLIWLPCMFGLTNLRITKQPTADQIILWRRMHAGACFTAPPQQKKKQTVKLHKRHITCLSYRDMHGRRLNESETWPSTSTPLRQLWKEWKKCEW